MQTFPLRKQLNTKRHLLQANFDSIGFLSLYTIRIKFLIRGNFVIKIDCHENLLKQLVILHMQAHVPLHN